MNVNIASFRLLYLHTTDVSAFKFNLTFLIAMEQYQKKKVFL
jgi:hypothetical protein